MGWPDGYREPTASPAGRGYLETLPCSLGRWYPRIGRCVVTALAVQWNYRCLEISDRNLPQSSRDATLVYHFCYATVLKAADVRYDVRGYLLSELVSLCLGNRATVPLAYRARYERYVQSEAIAFVESFTGQLLFGSGRFSPHEYRYRVEGPVAPRRHHHHQSDLPDAVRAHQRGVVQHDGI